MTPRPIDRLVLVGSAIVDLVMYVDALPEPGGDALARRSMTSVGGGFNVLAAAARQGLAAAYAGLIGTGPFGDLVHAAMAAEGVEVLIEDRPAADTGFCVALVDRAGERTFVTTVGAEGQLDEGRLAALQLGERDAVYLSGYDLSYPHGRAIAEWVGRLPTGPVLFDPGPLVAEIDPDTMDGVLGCVSWLSLNLREGVLLTSRADPQSIARAVFERVPRIDGVIVRDGRNGCDVFVAGEDGQHLPAPEVQAVDTNGAGDVHVAVFLAGLARGAAPVQAARLANDAAARSVTILGPGGELPGS